MHAFGFDTGADAVDLPTSRSLGSALEPSVDYKKRHGLNSKGFPRASLQLVRFHSSALALGVGECAERPHRVSRERLDQRHRSPHALEKAKPHAPSP